MFKKNLQPYVILGIALLILSLTPKKTQNILRNQFIRPLIPLSFLLPKTVSKNAPTKNISLSKEKYTPFFPNSTVAKVIFRNPTSWNDFFWVKLEKGSKVVKKSPVVFQNTLIGIVDFVGKGEARVKLITSMDLTVSVRSFRGKGQYQDLYHHIDALLSYHCIQENKPLSDSLSIIKEQIIHSSDSFFPSKGEIVGSSQPFWRSGGKLLFGKGFNASFQDHLTLAKELSQTLQNNNNTNTPLIEPDDLLITTGLDGVFPENLFVARVLTIDPLEEGDYYYNLSAAPIASNLDQIRYVEIIEPVGYQNQKVSFMD